MNTYCIQLRGQVDVNELNPMSSHLMTDIRLDSNTTFFTICTDQSGMIGLLRQLHHLGFEFVSVVCQPEHS